MSPDAESGTREGYVVREAANKLVARLSALEILREVTGHARNRRFRYDPYVRLFTDDMPEATP